ncbi:MAG: hypothetical protein ACTHL9_01350, partial [Sinomonas sp.]
YPGLTGYGSLKTTLIGVGVLAISIVAYVVRKLQDKEPLQWRDRTPDVPPSEAAVPVTGGASS